MPAGNGSLMVSVSGVRGLLGRGMNPEAAARFTAAYAAWLGGSRVVIGRDSRASGPVLSSAAVSALRFRGIDVVDLGIASTPTVEIMVGELGADGGIIVTASHNNERWNALKFLDGNGEFIDSSAVRFIRERVESSDSLFDAPSGMGTYEMFGDADRVHIGRITGLECIDRRLIASKGFKVVVDCVNGAGSGILPGLLSELGADVVRLHTDTDKSFPHDPEPRPANLGDLSMAVVREKADIGFACDPDADRLVLVDDRGTVCSEELTLALAADYILGVEKGPVAANISSSRLVEDIARRHGVEAHRSKVGEANVIAVMKEKKAVIGGEGNGGVIYPRIHYGRDAMTGAAIILQSLAKGDVSLRKVISGFPSYEIVKDKYEFDGDLDSIAGRLKDEFHGEFSDLDGIKIDMEEGWIHLRRSNTEPVVRVIAEAVSREMALSLAGKAGDILMSSR